jgi:DNA repair exonuclease SbcCD ATPase subunit
MAKQKKDYLEKRWFLRTGSEAVFGPVDGCGLLLWAEQARVLPGHEVSNDRNRWFSAVTVEFLDMRWFIDDGDGELKGPLNRKAAEMLIKGGKFTERARIIPAAEAEKSGDYDVRNIDTSRIEDHNEESAPLRKKVVVESSEDTAVTLKSVPAALANDLNRIATGDTQLQSKKEEKLCGRDAAVIDELKRENESLRHSHALAEKKAMELNEKLRNLNNRITQTENELNDKNRTLAESDKKLKEAVQLRESALQRARESERSFARLLSDANKRDIEYREKIEALKKNIAITPDQTDRFYRDRSAVYQILKRELDSVYKTIESERQYLESLKKLETERISELEKHRQQLQNHLGGSPAEMTSRVSREQSSDPNSVRLRSELDNLRLAHQRATQQFDERERELTHKLQVMQSDSAKLMDQLLEKERDSQELQAVSEKLIAAQHELSELRKGYEAERRQFIANNNALAARVVELENGGLRGARSDEAQSVEAHGVKLASWMSFKK